MANKASTGIGITDRSISSLSGSSQKLMSQNLQRGAMVINNIGNANIGVLLAALSEDGSDTTGTAAIGSAGTYTIVPNGSWTMGDGGFIHLGAVYIIGTAGQPVSAFESV